MSEPEDKGLHVVRPDENVVPYRSPRTKEEYTEYLAMLAFMAAWGVLFLGLFMAYLIARSAAPKWPPEGSPALPVGLGALNCLVIAASSLALHLAVRALRQGLRQRAIQGMVAAVALGGMFLALQAAVWTDLVARGLTLETGAYAELYFVLTGFQALQLGVGELALFYVLARTWRGLINPARIQPVRLWALYWHASTGIWLLTFLSLYLA